jgi:hypothetical protein
MQSSSINLNRFYQILNQSTMKQTLFLFIFAAIAFSGNAQIRTKTVPVGAPVIKNNRVLLTPAVLKQRQETYKGSFTNPSITRVTNGIKIVSNTSTNSTESPGVNTSQAPGAPSTESGMDCTTTREKVTAISSSFLTVSDNALGIYPGALYTFNDFMLGNWLKEVGVGKRNPLQISTDNYANSTGNVSVPVNNPTSVSINSAVASLVRNSSVQGVSASQIGQYSHQQNQASFLLGISGGGAYSGFAASGSFSYNKQSNHIFMTCDFRIPLYTLSTNYPENGFLTDPNLEKTPNLIVVSSVTYGTRVLVNIDIDENNLSTEAKAKFKYGDPNTAGFNIDLNFLLQNKDIKTTVNSYVVGASPKNLGNPTTIQDIYKFVDACIQNTNYQTAKPLSYTLSTMSGDLIAIKSATDEYVVKNCTPKNSIVYLRSFKIKVYTKGNYKEQGSNFVAHLKSAGGSKNLVSSLNNNSKFGPDKFDEIGFSIPPRQILKSEFNNGQNFIDIVLDKPNCVFSCDDWEIDYVSITCDFEDQNGVPMPGGVAEKELFKSKSFVLTKGKTLRVSFDSGFGYITANIL